MSAVISYDAMVEQLVGLSVPREKAEARARELCGVPAPDPATIAEQQRRDLILEKTEQLEVRKRFIVCRCKVYSLSQARAAKQTPGLADLWVVHETRPIAFWWETKRQVGGTHSEAQRDFAAECVRCSVGYGTGDRYDAERYLIDRGLARYVAGVFEPIQH